MTHWTPARIAEAKQRAELAEFVTLPVAQFRELLERVVSVAVPPGDVIEAMVEEMRKYTLDHSASDVAYALGRSLISAEALGYVLTKQPSAAVAKINGGGDE